MIKRTDYGSESQIGMSTLPEMIHLGLGWIGDRGGGLERYQHGICSAHAEMGHQVTAWVQSRTPIDEPTEYKVLPFTSQEHPRVLRLAALRRLSLERFSRIKTDPLIMISHHASVSKSLAKPLRDMPHAVHFQGPWADEAQVEGAPRWKYPLQQRSERIAYQTADQIITLSTAFHDIVIENYGVDPKRVNVIPGGIDAWGVDPKVTRQEARERLGWPTDRPILVSIRRLVRRVGVDVLVDAFAKIVDRHPDALLMLGGTGPLKEELEEKISDAGLELNVRLLGFIPDEELSLAYRAADFSVVPTQELEGFGLVVIESLAVGTPALVTPIGSLPEVVGDLEPSLIFDGKSARQIADGLLSVLDGEREIPSDAECQEYVRNHFDWSVIAPKVLEVYRRTLL